MRALTVVVAQQRRHERPVCSGAAPGCEMSTVKKPPRSTCRSAGSTGWTTSSGTPCSCRPRRPRSARAPRRGSLIGVGASPGVFIRSFATSSMFLRTGARWFSEPPCCWSRANAELAAPVLWPIPADGPSEINRQAAGLPSATGSAAACAADAANSTADTAPSGAARSNLRRHPSSYEHRPCRVTRPGLRRGPSQAAHRALTPTSSETYNRRGPSWCTSHKDGRLRVEGRRAAAPPRAVSGAVSAGAVIPDR